MDKNQEQAPKEEAKVDTSSKKNALKKTFAE